MEKIDFNTLLGPQPDANALQVEPLNGHELDDLLSPMSRQEFVDSHFAKTSMHLAGPDNKFRHLFSWERLKQALIRGERINNENYNITASYAAGEDSGNPKSLTDINHRQVIEVLNGGGTICITNIQMADPILARWALTICAQLNFTGTVGINCYVSADGSGLPMHYDARVATSIQIEGEKYWKYSTEAAKPWPRTNAVYEAGQGDKNIGKLPPDMQIKEVKLTPGDLLCLPAGAWHSARAKGCSMALNLSFSPKNYLEQLMPTLKKFAESNAKWRGGPPVSAEKIQGALPQEVSSYIDERLDELHDLVKKEWVNGDAATGRWLASLTRASYTGETQVRPLAEVNLDQRFTASTPPFRYIEHQNVLLLSFNNSLHRFPLNMAPIFQRLSSEPFDFTMAEIISLAQTKCSMKQHEILHYMKVLYQFSMIDFA